MEALALNAKLRHDRAMICCRALLLFIMAFAFGLAGCGRTPDMDQDISEDIRNAPYPLLVPLEDITVAGTGQPRATPDLRAAIEVRADALRGRASGLTGPVLSAPARDRIAAGRARLAALVAEQKARLASR